MLLSPFPALLAYAGLLIGAKTQRNLQAISAETQVVLAVAYICRYWSLFLPSPQLLDPLTLVRALYIILPIVTIYQQYKIIPGHRTLWSTPLFILFISSWLPISYHISFPESQQLTGLLKEFSFSCMFVATLPQIDRYMTKLKNPDADCTWTGVWLFLICISHWLYLFESLSHPGTLDVMKLALSFIGPLLETLGLFFSFLCCGWSKKTEI